MKTDHDVEIAIIGAGIAGIATAYYLTQHFGRTSVLLIDPRQPMSYTSAQSGDNYRNWWPHPTMAAFTNDSIDELERLSVASDNVFHMSRGGYVLATRNDNIAEYETALTGDIDVDVFSGNTLKNHYPFLHDSIANVLHIRRGGDISGQQLGNWMLEQLRAAGGRRLLGEVVGIEPGYRLAVETDAMQQSVSAKFVINAAGPFATRISSMLGLELPVTNVYQQKIAFEDTRAAIPRDMPFSIDLDTKTLDWSDEERELLAADEELSWLTKPIHGGTHCRPEGGAAGKWVKLGWAYNHTRSEPQQDLANEPAMDPQFPEIVIRGAAAFLPSLQNYVDEPPTRFTHYGGYYTMTEENWPLIGPLNNDGAFLVAALSGFGSMAACAAGKLCAAHVCDASLPPYADDLSMARLDNPELIAELRASNKGIL